MLAGFFGRDGKGALWQGRHRVQTVSAGQQEHCAGIQVVWCVCVEGVMRGCVTCSSGCVHDAHVSCFSKRGP